MKNKIRSSLIRILIIFVIIFSVQKSYALVPVIDGINLPHNVMTAVSAYNDVMQSIEQLAQLKTELEYTIKNTLAPGFWVWDKVKNFDENMNDLKSKLDSFANGGIEDYLRSYLDIDFYRNSPCFKFGGCSYAEMAVLQDNQRDRLEGMRKTSTIVAKGIDKYLKGAAKKQKDIIKLQENTKSANGRMEAAQYSNQWLSIQTNILMDMNANLMTLQNQIKALTDEYYSEKAQQSEFSKNTTLMKLDTNVKGLSTRYKYLNLR